jgi:hypothetical protein
MPSGGSTHGDRPYVRQRHPFPRFTRFCCNWTLSDCRGVPVVTIKSWLLALLLTSLATIAWLKETNVPPGVQLIKLLNYY